MNSKEILIKAIKREPTPRIPVMILSGGLWVVTHAGMSFEEFFKLEPEKAADIIIETNKKLNADLIFAAAGLNNIGISGIGGEVLYSKLGAAPSIEKPILNNIEELDKLDVNMLAEDPIIKQQLSITKILAEKVGNEKMIGISQWGPITLAGQILGIELFMRCLIKNKPVAHKLIEFTTELCYKYWELFVGAGAEFVEMADPTGSGDMISKKQFNEFVVPYAKKLSDRIKATGKVKGVMLHICGDTSKFLDILPETGADIMSFDYKVDLGAARAALDGKMAFTGNMDPVEIMNDGSAEKVFEACNECIEKADGKKGGYIVMPGCDIPPTTPLENIEAMVRAAHSCTQ